MAKDEKSKEQKLKERKAMLLGGMAGLAAQSGGAVANAAVIPYLVQDLARPHYFGDMPLWLEDPGRYSKALRMEKFLEIDKPIRYRTNPYGMSYWMEGPWEDEIGLHARSTPTLAHELGHASKSRFIKPLSNFAQRYPIGIPLGVAASLGMALSGNEAAQNLAPVAGVMPYVPELAEEARSSIQGTRAIRAIEGRAAAAKAAFALAPAFMTYLASTIGPAVLAPWLAKNIQEHYEKEHEKTSQVKGGTGNLQLTSYQAYASRPPKPKTTKPKQMPPGSSVKPNIPTKAKPPSKQKYYTDAMKSMNFQGRGFRYA